MEALRTAKRWILATALAGAAIAAAQKASAQPGALNDEPPTLQENQLFDRSGDDLDWANLIARCEARARVLTGAARKDQCLLEAQDAWRNQCRKRLYDPQGHRVDSVCRLPRAAAKDGLWTSLPAADESPEEWASACRRAFIVSASVETVDKICCPPGIAASACDAKGVLTADDILGAAPPPDDLLAKVRGILAEQTRRHAPIDRSGGLPPMPGTLTTPLSWEEIYERTAPSIYLVEGWDVAPEKAQANSEPVAFGTAVAVTDAILVTNCHVVASHQAISITHPSWGDSKVFAEIIHADWGMDRCWVRAYRESLELFDMLLTPIRGVRSWDSVKKGEAVAALGNPQGLTLSISVGIVSNKWYADFRDFPDGGPQRWIQSDANTAPGSSGGALLDRFGNLVGVTQGAFNVFEQQSDRSVVKRSDGNLGKSIAIEEFWPEEMRFRSSRTQ